MTLDGSLTATVSDGGVRFEFTVANAGDAPVEVTFPDGCLIDVEVRDGDGTVWQFSEGQMFMQMVQSETVEPGAQWTESVAWEDPAPGEYEVRAWLCANDADCEAATTLSV